MYGVFGMYKHAAMNLLHKVRTSTVESHDFSWVEQHGYSRIFDSASVEHVHTCSLNEFVANALDKNTSL